MKILLLIVIVLVVAGGVWYLQGGILSLPRITPSAEETPEEAEAPPQESAQTEAPAAPAAPENAVIRATADGFVPAALTIKKGAPVIFQNESGDDVWPASAMHPTHIGYPVTGGCIGSAFDACRGLKIGEVWSFAFDMSGTWRYHDHLYPKHFGSITVEE